MDHRLTSDVEMMKKERRDCLYELGRIMYNTYCCWIDDLLGLAWTGSSTVAGSYVLDTSYQGALLKMIEIPFRDPSCIPGKDM
jgi:hypothetical protein